MQLIVIAYDSHRRYAQCGEQYHPVHPVSISFATDTEFSILWTRKSETSRFRENPRKACRKIGRPKNRSGLFGFERLAGQSIRRSKRSFVRSGRLALWLVVAPRFSAKKGSARQSSHRAILVWVWTIILPEKYVFSTDQWLRPWSTFIQPKTHLPDHNLFSVKGKREEGETSGRDGTRSL